MRRPSEDDIDFPKMSSPHPLHLPLDRVVDRLGGGGIGSVADRSRARGGEGGPSGCCSIGAFSCFWCSSRFSITSERLPWPIAGSVGESGLKNAAGIVGTSSIVPGIRPGSSRIVCRVRGGNSSTSGPRLRGSDGLCRFKLTSEGRLDMELPLRVSDGGDESEEVEPSGC